MERDEVTPDAPQGALQLLCFRAGGAQFAVPVERVEEVTPRSEITVIPGVPKHIPGIVAVRGDAIPLFDLASFVGLAGATPEADRDERVLVVRAGRYRVGVVCEVVTGVLGVPSSALGEPTAIQPATLRGYTRAQVDRASGVIAVLELERLLEDARA